MKRTGPRTLRATRPMVIAGLAATAALVAGTTAAAEPIRPGSLTAVAATPCTASARACVELAEHQAWLIDNGVVVRGPVPVMDGLDGETPTGTFGVEWKAEHWTSRELGTPMPFSVFFAPGGIAFHEGDQDSPSAGCVKLVEQDARAFFEFLQVGDEVQVR